MNRTQQTVMLCCVLLVTHAWGAVKPAPTTSTYQPAYPVDNSQQTTSSPASDSYITGSIKAQLASETSIIPSSIQVDTQHGIVFLAGMTNSDSDAAELIQLAQATEGVRDVDSSKLFVKSSQHPFSDMSITAKVKGLFVREKLFDGEDIDATGIVVETKNGVVYLTGSANSKEQVNNAITLVKSVRGVKKVDSRVVTPENAN